MIIAAATANGPKKEKVTLVHRGCGPIKYKLPDRPGMWDVTDESDLIAQGEGISVNVLTGESGLSDDVLGKVHDDLVSWLRYRLKFALADVCIELAEKGHETLAVSVQRMFTRNPRGPYMDMINGIYKSTLLRSKVNAPCCAVRTLALAPDMELSSSLSVYNKVKVVRPIPSKVMEQFATCASPGWNVCSFMLKSAEKRLEELNVPVIDRKKIGGVGESVWDALEYILLEFRIGSNCIGAQEAFEICLFRHAISNGDLVFKNENFSGLHTNPRLARYVELGYEVGFWTESLAVREIVRHDIKHALSM